MPHWLTRLAVVTLLALTAFAAGCASTTKMHAGHRIDEGYTVVLPGIMANRSLDPNLVQGLINADLPSAIEMYDWTNGSPNLIYNLRGEGRNRREAQRLAQKIIDYQDRYPGRPIYLVGYSGGAGIAVMALEALPPDRKIDGVVLLAPALAPEYDLRLAMNRTRSGIHNFYSREDVSVMTFLSTLVGTMDGRHTTAAGGIGFRTPDGLQGEQRQQYQQKLVQHSYTPEMASYGHHGDHYGWTKSDFVTKWIGPLVRRDSPGMSQVVRNTSPEAPSSQSHSSRGYLPGRGMSSVHRLPPENAPGNPSTSYPLPSYRPPTIVPEEPQSAVAWRPTRESNASTVTLPARQTGVAWQPTRPSPNNPTTAAWREEGEQSPVSLEITGVR